MLCCGRLSTWRKTYIRDFDGKQFAVGIGMVSLLLYMKGWQFDTLMLILVCCRSILCALTIQKKIMNPVALCQWKRVAFNTACSSVIIHPGIRSSVQYWGYCINYLK